MSEVDLSDLLPKLPLEELLLRESLGAPGQPPVEVGLRRERFGEARGEAISNRHLGLLRALGGVPYPADREGVLRHALPRLRSLVDMAEALQGLPDAVYGGEIDVLRELELARRHSAGGGSVEGSGAAQ